MPRQEEKDYDDLFQCHHKLQRQYRSVVQKHKAAIQKIKKQNGELATLKLRQQTPPLTPSERREMDGCLRKASNSHQETDEKDDLLAVISKRLTDAEKELRLLKEDRVEHDSDWERSKKTKSNNDSQIQIASLTTHLHELATQHELDTLRLSLQEDKLKKIMALHNEYTTRHAALKKELHLYESERNQL